MRTKLQDLQVQIQADLSFSRIFSFVPFGGRAGHQKFWTLLKAPQGLTRPSGSPTGLAHNKERSTNKLINHSAFIISWSLFSSCKWRMTVYISSGFVRPPGGHTKPHGSLSVLQVGPENFGDPAFHQKEQNWKFWELANQLQSQLAGHVISSWFEVQNFFWLYGSSHGKGRNIALRMNESEDMDCEYDTMSINLVCNFPIWLIIILILIN